MAWHVHCDRTGSPIWPTHHCFPHTEMQTSQRTRRAIHDNEQWQLCKAASQGKRSWVHKDQQDSGSAAMTLSSTAGSVRANTQKQQITFYCLHAFNANWSQGNKPGPPGVGRKSCLVVKHETWQNPKVVKIIQLRESTDRTEASACDGLATVVFVCVQLCDSNCGTCLSECVRICLCVCVSSCVKHKVDSYLFPHFHLTLKYLCQV